MKIQLHVTLCTLLATLVVANGCASVPSMSSIGKKMPWSKKKDEPKPYPNPTRMATTWIPDTLVQTGRTPTRGFGGRVFFYDEKTKAVPVDGELTVHAFAEMPDGSQGDVKRYHFTAEQFTQHFSQTDLGASYSVWIPWDAVGGEQTRVSLVPSFRTVGGKMVQGEQTVCALPGKRSASEQASLRRTAAEILNDRKGDGKIGMVTTTIPVRSTLMRESAPAIAVPGAPLAPPSTMLASNQPKAPSTLPGPPAIAATASKSDEPAITKSGPRRLGQSVMRASADLPIE